ncbi:MAG: hypothetical protein HEQ27_01560 [Dolichospermum sp. JUN01]|nr:hypothetical protein [Dolichospermum sp. JUN01]
MGDAGNDSYYVDNTADTITELVNQGTDIVFTTVTYTLTTNTENLTLQGTTAITRISHKEIEKRGQKLRKCICRKLFSSDKV